MRRIFYGIFVGLLVFSYLVVQGLPEKQSNKPILFWATGYDWARQAQIDEFHKWLEKNAPPEDQFILKPDIANNDKQKVIIQCVSGVGPDIIDIISESGYMQYYNKMGIIEDLTVRAQEMGFEAEKTYAAVEDALKVDEQQFLFPCNVSTNLYYVNKNAFKELGVEVPSADWTYAEFEKASGEFRKSAIDKYGYAKGRYYFLMGYIDTLTLLRNTGACYMNETLTASAFTRKNEKGEGLSEVLAMKHRWIFKDHYLPSSADIETVEAGVGGVNAQLFRIGHIGMHLTGRWQLTAFRTFKTEPKFTDIELAVVPPPQNGFQNTTAMTRAASMYIGISDRRKHLASYFFKFLASKEYNQTIVDCTDALPPVPAYAQTEEFLHPPEYENEWPIHEAFSTALDDYGILVTHSPFIATNIVNNELKGAQNAVLMETSRLKPSEAAERAHQRVEKRIIQNLKEDPTLVPAYEAACAVQRQIDELRGAGKKIPRSLVKNRFYLKYYESKGMLE